MALATLVALTVGIYAELWNTPSLSWDDDSNIFRNPYFRLGRWWGVWTEPYFGLYVPITSSVWAGLLFWGKNEIWPFRFLNIGLHAANIVLVFLVLRSFARRWKLDPGWPVVIATAVFALHPLQVQAVAWVSGGRDLLAAFFALSSVLVYFRWTGGVGYVGALTLFVAALMSKPNVVVVPALIFAAEVWLEGRSWKRSAVKVAPWLVAALAAIHLTQSGQNAHFEITAQWWQRPYLMLDSYRFYVLKTLWPDPLSANYSHTPPRVFADANNLWKAALALVAMGAATYWAWRRDRRYFVAVFWFLLLLPVSGIIGFAYENIGGVADHYNYLPLVVVGIMLLPPLAWLGRRPLAYVLPLAVIAILTQITWSRLPVWTSDTSFFMDMAKVSPDSYNTALGMSIVMCTDIKDYDAGVQWTEKALAQHPNDILALANQAFCYSHAGRSAKVVEMATYLAKLDRGLLKSNQPTAYSSFLASLGSAFIAERKYEVGFQLLCEAYRVLPSEPNYVKNVEAGAAILTRNGFHPKCEPFESQIPPAPTDRSN